MSGTSLTPFFPEDRHLPHIHLKDEETEANSPGALTLLGSPGPWEGGWSFPIISFPIIPPLSKGGGVFLHWGEAEGGHRRLEIRGGKIHGSNAWTDNGEAGGKRQCFIGT